MILPVLFNWRRRRAALAAANLADREQARRARLNLRQARVEARTAHTEAAAARNDAVSTREATKAMQAALSDIRALIESDPENRTERHEQNLIHHVITAAAAAEKAAGKAKRTARHATDARPEQAAAAAPAVAASTREAADPVDRASATAAEAEAAGRQLAEIDCGLQLLRSLAANVIDAAASHDDSGLRADGLEIVNVLNDIAPRLDMARSHWQVCNRAMADAARHTEQQATRALAKRWAQQDGGD